MQMTNKTNAAAKRATYIVTIALSGAVIETRKGTTFRDPQDAFEYVVYRAVSRSVAKTRALRIFRGGR